MNKHAERLLEFEKIKTECTEYCFSEEGKAFLLSQEIQSDAQIIAAQREKARAFRRALESGETFPELSFPEIAGLMPHLGKQGIAFETVELLAIALYIRSARDLRRFIEKAAPSDALKREAGELPELDDLARELLKFIDLEGNLKEKEIPALKAIRARVRSLHGEIAGLAQNYLQDSGMQPFWQSTTPTIREGRTVLPMKANFRGRVKGIVHELSSSGATVFIEPLDIVEKNNALVEQENLYRQEVLRILRELTSKAGDRKEELSRLISVTASLDATYARARYAAVHDCTEAREVEGGITLLAARHPLLGKKAVPIDVQVDPEVNVVIITGPNTGGKTVSLKTVGLLAMMNQFGMEIPAAEGSGLPYFDTILADIGDEQSIEQSLSTFSGHMVAISSIIEESSERSLVLLDELGSGTDPEEGSALAMSLLDHFIEKKSLSFVTTHHGILKNYGYTRRGVQNACVEFDAKSLSPTYRIIVGVPGESHAVDIASRNGIPPFIIEQARTYLNDERTDVGKLIKSLSEKQRELYEREKSQEEHAKELRELRRNTDLRALRLKQREHELRRQGVSDLSRFLDESRKKLENLVKELREGELTREKTKSVKRFIEDLGVSVEQENLRLDELEAEVSPEPEPGERDIEPGDEVLIGQSKKRGTVLRRDKGNRWLVSTGSLRIAVPERDLVVVQSGKHGEAGVEISVSGVSADNAPAFQLDVRGMRLEEALSTLRDQIDRALMTNLQEFSIIHGKGEGILQKGIHDFLRSARGVTGYHFARPEEGGYGKTIVRLVE